MTAFIKQEAMEKAREIEIKANEEFEIEKSKLVRQETDSIDATYEKKLKQATMSQQITRSTVANKTRLRVLGARQELLDSIYEATRKQLAGGIKDKGKYQKMLTGLVLEGLYTMNEADVQVRGRKKDADVVKKALDDAAKTYKKEVGKDVKLTLDDENPVPDARWAYRYCRSCLCRLLTCRVVLVVSSLSAPRARLRLTTLSRRASSCSKTRPPPPFARPCLERTRTASSTTKSAPSALPVGNRWCPYKRRGCWPCESSTWQGRAGLGLGNSGALCMSPVFLIVCIVFFLAWFFATLFYI